MTLCLWFIFLCGACVYNWSQLSKRKSVFSSLLLSPDVNDKVSCGFGSLFWYAFQTRENFTHTEANLHWRFFLLSLLLSFCASESKTVKGVKQVTSLFSCNDFRKLEVCSVLFLRQFDLVGAQARPLSPSLTHALLKPWACIRHSQVITCHTEANTNSLCVSEQNCKKNIR